MKIGFFETQTWQKDFVEKALLGQGVNLFFSPKKITPLSLPSQRDFEVLSIFVDSRLEKKVLDCFPNLKFIAVRATGYDNIDLKECAQRGILVANVPGYGDNTVAEFAFGLILNLTRKIYHSIDQIKERSSFSLKGLLGVDLKGKTLGVVGVGRIGKEMIKIAKGFGMKVIASDPFPDFAFQKEMGFEYVSLEELLSRADIISLHAPLNEKTYHLINKENIKKIKKGAYLINTARGGLVETEALVMALKKGILAGAGLDVLEEEGEIKDELNFLTKAKAWEKTLKNIIYNHILMDLPNVLITPHNAFNSKEALERILQTTLLNIQSFLAGKPINLVKG
jgi:D-lactate dehydrogenase